MKNLLFVLVTVFGLVACGGGGGSSSGGGTGGSGGNRAPSASFTVACADLDCTFTNNSTDSDGTVASSSWNFGDGATATTTDANHTFGSYGSYTVSLTVTDNDGATGSTSRSVTVAVDVHAQVVSIDMFDESIVFKQDFDHRMDGDITVNDLNTDLGCTGPGCANTIIDMEEFAYINGEMKGTFKANQIGTRVGASIPLDADYSELYLTFQVRFDTDYDQSASGGKLMGLGGHPNGISDPPGGCVTVGADEGFSSRFTYRQTGLLANYVYHQNKTEACGEYNYIDDASETDNYFHFQKEVMYTLEMRVVMNTPGQKNGYIETYINGVKMSTTPEYTLSESGNYGINFFVFNLYIGGDTSDWELANPSTLYLDNFVLSTARVVE